ncbi:hypothetical protein J8273_5350 [Carpediemonas membranifera]|uniref:BED-type domain-containing protein n=1 Tax=Carpediemonas membranifera TaxID=201153 RepID=A0A8J6ATY9_9EUKA|nr:hypothetical protein J8273_5350 [Carpediemonas membranifera]|eukprot:KAG9392360.1 hypothetical protein J8273_5350 [Carpediemonas membranifera]
MDLPGYSSLSHQPIPTTEHQPPVEAPSLAPAIGDEAAASSSIQTHFYLWNWPDKKMYLRKMKDDTINRLDLLWANGDWSHRKDHDKIKQCKICQSYFAPGTSTVQLMAHVTKCQQRTNLGPQPLDEFKPPFVPPARLAVSDVPSVPPVVADIPYRISAHELNAHIEEDCLCPLQARLADLSRKEQELNEILMSLMYSGSETGFKRTLMVYQAIQYAVNDVSLRIRRLEDADTHVRIPPDDPMPGALPLPPVVTGNKSVL